MLLISWVRDLIVENKLKRLGAKISVEKDIKLSSIAIELSKHNNARLREAFNDDLAVEYACAMEGGDKFPMVVLWKAPGQKKYSVLSGNHRVGAVDALDVKSIDAYILEGQDEQLAEVITRTANRWMGDRQSKEEAVEHAKVMIAKFNFTNKEAAQLLNVKIDWLAAAIRAEHTRDSLSALLVDSRDMPRGTLCLLAQIDFNETLFRDAGHLVSRFKMSRDRVQSLITEMKSQPDEQTKLAVVKKWETMLTAEKPRASVAGTKMKDQSRLRRHMNTLTQFIKTGRSGKAFETLSQLKLTTPTSKAECQKMWKELKALVDEIFRREAADQAVQRKRERTAAATPTRRRRRRKSK